MQGILPDKSNRNERPKNEQYRMIPNYQEVLRLGRQTLSNLFALMEYDRSSKSDDNETHQRIHVSPQ